MKRFILIILLAFIMIAFVACDLPTDKTDIRSNQQTQQTDETVQTNSDGTNMEKELHLFINDTEVSVEWQNNDSVNALIELVSTNPLIVQMSMYGGFEQVGSLGTNLPRNDKQTTTEAGDIVLYSGNQIVVFYGSNSWAYTRLGKIKDKSAAEMTELLGNGNIRITISYGEQNE